MTYFPAEGGLHPPWVSATAIAALGREQHSSLLLHRAESSAPPSTAPDFADQEIKTLISLLQEDVEKWTQSPIGQVRNTSFPALGLFLIPKRTS